MTSPKIITPRPVSDVDTRRQTMEDIVSLLSSQTKLERDRGAEQLRQFLPKSSRLEIINLLSRFKTMAEDDEKWETIHGALLGFRELARPLFHDLDSSEEKAYMDQILDISLALLQHKEVRVRLAAGLC
jgi:hypothetical protein